MRHPLRIALALAVALLPAPALAHGFGQRFDLPLPLSFWVTGAGASIVLSFVVMAIFVREHRADADYPHVDLFRSPALSWLGGPVVVEAIRAVAVVVFLVTIVSGFIGPQAALSSVIVPMIWVIWWVGIAFVCALVGNVWALINPLDTLYRWAEAAFRAVTGGRRLGLGLRYPRGLGVWPSVVFFFAFAWTELVWGETDIPASLARVTLIYSLLTFAGMFLFGRETWLRNGEAFSVAFGILSRFAPLNVPDRPAGARPVLELRPYGAGLLRYDGVTLSLFVMVLLMLSTVTFDGFIETPLYRSTTASIFSSPGLSTFLFQLSEYGMTERDIVLTIILFLFPLVFVLVFWLGCVIMVAVTRAWARRRSITINVTGGQAALAFVLTLVPIAVAYHLSHYFTYLVTQSVYVLPPLSDPFDLGWNLLGTADLRPTSGTMNPYVYWYVAVALIVIGHVIAVYLAHKVALRLFGSRGAALVSQLPMIVLMVLYTTLSLWILAQPIVG